MHDPVPSRFFSSPRSFLFTESSAAAAATSAGLAAARSSSMDVFIAVTFDSFLVASLAITLARSASSVALAFSASSLGIIIRGRLLLLHLDRLHFELLLELRHLLGRRLELRHAVAVAVDEHVGLLAPPVEHRAVERDELEEGLWRGLVEAALERLVLVAHLVDGQQGVRHEVDDGLLGLLCAKVLAVEEALGDGGERLLRPRLESMTTLFTSEGKQRARTRIGSPMGEKHRRTCRLALTCWMKKPDTLSRVSAMPARLHAGETVLMMSSCGAAAGRRWAGSAAVLARLVLSPEECRLFMKTGKRSSR